MSSLPQNATEKSSVWLYVLIAAAVLMNFSGIFVTIMGPDGTLYATIAKTMVLQHDYVNLMVKGHDWLDKPHFPFWMAAISFQLFGFTTWAYKLPAILFLLVGAWYTFLFARKLYNQQIALWATLILLTAQHILLSDNDVRAEAYLTGLVIASVYHFYVAYKKNSFLNLLAGAVFAACAIMTKGTFALIPIAGAFGGQFIITREWKQLFNLRWMLALILIMIFILPELYCLYRQFDLHPEKLVFSKHQVSGIRFFFWDSQFGRFFNTGPIKGSGDPFFFVHTLLWAFLPWSLLLFAGVYQTIKKGLNNVKIHEWFCVCGALLTFLVFSASQFQLPHYLNIVFPFFAIITAEYLYRIRSAASLRAVSIIQKVVTMLLILIVCTLQYFFRAAELKLFIAIVVALLLMLLVILPDVLTENVIQKTLIRTALVSFMINIFLNLSFYPSLMHFQAGSEAARWINTNNPAHLQLAQTDTDAPYAMEFYLQQPMITIEPTGAGSIPPKPFLLYGDQTVIDALAAKGWHISILKAFNNYKITRLNAGFLNNATRYKELVTTEVAVVKNFPLKIDSTKKAVETIQRPSNY